MVKKDHKKRNQIINIFSDALNRRYKMKDKPEYVRLVEVREKVEYEKQIADQVNKYRDATMQANPTYMGRTVNTLADLLWAWMPESDRKKFEELAPKKTLPSDLYTKEDKRKLKIYDVLDNSRQQTLARAARMFTAGSHTKSCRQQFRLLNKNMKNLGLSLKETGEENIGGDNPPESSYILSTIHNRIHKEKLNFLCLVTGHVGKGKSMVASTFARMLDPTFNLSRVKFSAEAVLDIVDGKDMPPGTSYVPDESGSFFEKRRAMSNKNLILTHMIQTFRMMQAITFWTVPNKNQIDSQLLQMADAIIEVKSVNRNSREVLASFKWLKPSAKGSNVMYNFPKKPRPGLDPLYITKIYVAHPNDGIYGMPNFENRYLKKKKKKLKVLYSKDRKLLTRDERKALGESADEKKYKYRCNKCGKTGETNLDRPRCSSCNTREVAVEDIQISS